MTTNPKKDKARLNIDIKPAELHKLKLDALRQHQTLTELVRERLGLDQQRAGTHANE